MPTDPIHQPTEDECWAEFWDRTTTVLANLYQQGWRPEMPEQPAAAAA